MKNELPPGMQDMPVTFLNLLRLTLQSAALKELDRDRPSSPEEEAAADRWLQVWISERDPAPPSREAAFGLFPRVVVLGSYLRGEPSFGARLPVEECSKEQLAAILVGAKPQLRELLRALQSQTN